MPVDKPITEATSLELHVELCAERYKRLEEKIGFVESSLERIHTDFASFKTENQKLQKSTNTWVAKKLWNEHLVQLQGKDYWFTIDPIFDLEVGKDSEADFSTTYNNTRGLLVRGGLGKNFNFYTSVFESQGRFAQYVNDYAESLKAFGPDPAIIPGRGIGKQFKTDSYDYPVLKPISPIPLPNLLISSLVMVKIL